MLCAVRGADFVPFSAIDFSQWLQGRIFIAAKNLDVKRRANVEILRCAQNDVGDA